MIPFLFPLSFELTSRSLTACIDTLPILSNCTFSNQDIMLFGDEGDVVIEDCSFVTFSSIALMLSPIGSILLSSVLFKDFQVTFLSGASAVVVGKATELRLSSVQFLDFFNSGAVDAETDMWTLYGVTSTNMTQKDALGIFKAVCPWLYGDDLTFANCSVKALFEMYGNVAHIGLVFRGLKTTGVSVLQSGGGLLCGFTGMPDVVIEGAVIKNTLNVYTKHDLRLFFESTEFIVEDGQELVGVRNNGDISVIDCSFRGCSIGVLAVDTMASVFVCRCSFENCATGIESELPDTVVVGCFFIAYTDVAVRFQNGMETADGQAVDTQVTNCAFSSSDVPAIHLGSGNYFVSQSCFGGNDLVIDVEEHATVRIGSRCFFRASATRAFSDRLSILSESEASEPLYDWTGTCDESQIRPDSVCTGYNFPPRRTPGAAPSPIIPIPEAKRTESTIFDASDLAKGTDLSRAAGLALSNPAFEFSGFSAAQDSSVYRPSLFSLCSTAPFEIAGFSAAQDSNVYWPSLGSLCSFVVDVSARMIAKGRLSRFARETGGRIHWSCSPSGTHEFSETGIFILTDAFVMSPPGPTPIPTVTVSPIPTETEYIPRQGLTESWVASLSHSWVEVTDESITVSFSDIEQERLVTVTFLIDGIATVSNSIMVEQTRVAISWVVVMITHLPVYITVSRRVAFYFSITPEALLETRLSNAVLIGSTCGAAAIIVLLIIAVIAVVRGKAKNDSVTLYQVGCTVNRPGITAVDELGRLDETRADAAVGLNVDAELSDLEIGSEGDGVYI
jgi:hypothetical protein